MSQLCVETVACPRCAAQEEMTLFRSLNGARVPAQVDSLVSGSFELHACLGCGHEFRPEHRMLYAHVAAGSWIVMYPRAERARFAELEQSLAVLFEQEVASAPVTVAPVLAGCRPRLVFGQHMLSESVRLERDGLDAALLECAKLLLYRRQMQRLVPHGPVELCYEGAAGDGMDGANGPMSMRLGVHALGTGERVAELLASAAVLEEAAAARPELERRYPELFRHPYVSATRYLWPPQRSR